MRLQSVLLAIGFVLCSSTVAAVDCGHLFGSWTSNRFDQTLGLERTTSATFHTNGRFEISFQNEDEEMPTRRRGRWSCDGSELTLVDELSNGTLFTHVYSILTLEAEYFVFEAVRADCDRVEGDCVGTVFGLVRAD